jgi:nucleotide-binding universal stress UspA family protein
MREIHRILCPVDLSDVSRHAIAHAELLAGWYRAKITALHVFNPLVIPAADFAAVGATLPSVLTEHEIESARQDVEKLFSPPPDRPIEVVVESGNIAQRILEREKAINADLIVIGTHGHGGFQHLVLGSVAEKVLRKATCPVLTVPPRSRTTSRLPFQRILCPVDFSESSLASVEYAQSLAAAANADLIVLHVVDWIDEPLTTRPIAMPEYRRELEHQAGARLDALVAGLSAGRRRTGHLGHGKPYREILGVANEEGCDLIVIGVHGRNPFDLMLFGSTTNQVIRRAACPVLTVRG